MTPTALFLKVTYARIQMFLTTIVSPTIEYTSQIKPIKLLVVLILSLLFLTSCGEKEVTPPPHAQFFFDLERDERDNFVTELQDGIFLDNSSSNSTEFLWEFGDGTTSSDKSLTYTYSERGSYGIKLTASNDRGETSSAQKQVLVGGRSFRNLVVNKMSNFKPNGQPWDAGSPPDLIFLFGEVDNPQSNILLSFFPDITLDKIPFGGDVDFGENIFLTNKKWFFKLYDNDEPMNTFDANDELMIETEFNPTQVGIRNLSTRFGRFDITNGIDADGNSNSDYELAITWDFKVDQE